MTFIRNTKSIIPFSFQVEPNSNTLSLTNSITLEDQIGWNNSTRVLTDGAVNNSKTVVLDTIAGIKVGDRIYCKELDNKTIIKVASLDSATNVTLDTNVTLSDNAKLSFTNNHQINLLNASKLVIGNDVFIRGHLEVNSVEENVVIPILLDNIITAV
jgi:hypothetical protein